MTLVITIVILIILATVSINAIFGENGLIKSSERAKIEHEKGMAREQIELVLADAFVEKNTNSKYNEHEFLDKFIEVRLEGVNIGEEEIELNGFVFELDRSIPRLGKYLGEATGPRIKEIKVTDKTTSSISVEVEARNTEGGEYIYLYKKDTEGEEAWKEAHKGSENTYTFSNLEANKIYNIKIKVTTNEGEAEGTVNVITGEIPEEAVIFGNVTWSSGTASVTVDTNTEMQIEYQVNALTEGSWKTIANGGTISGIQHGQTVYARLTDGTNRGDPASVGITDTVAPIVSGISTGTITQNSIQVTVTASDNESGLATSETYKYYLNGAETATNENNSYTFTGLTAETEYTIKVEVYDKAKNKGESSIQVTTIPPKNINELKSGEYINYTDGKGQIIKCIVLYDSSSEYGVQIITADTVEDVTLGSSNFDDSRKSYNDAMTTLNNKANEYNNSAYTSSARCVGSVPNNPNLESGFYQNSESWFINWNDTFKDTDDNYMTDYSKMKELNIHNLNKNYWLASRRVVNSPGEWCNFNVRRVEEDGNHGHIGLGNIDKDTGAQAYAFTYGFRPVFTLKLDIKIVCGNGSIDNPYQLGV